jgi:hypothetical protein
LSNSLGEHDEDYDSKRRRRLFGGLRDDSLGDGKIYCDALICLGMPLILDEMKAKAAKLPKNYKIEIPDSFSLFKFLS